LRALQKNDPLVFFEVSPELVTGIVAEWTGIPESKLSGIDSALITGIGERLRRRILGQDEALSAVEKAIMAAHAGLDNPGRPNGIFLLVGPSGVGKTETALAVADELFGGERMLISINMSEFQEKHTVSRLIGSPPGYVGYGEGGRLTEAVRRQPYSAVLFDEVEKAHPDILNLFYQVFDKGILADGEGREVDFRNTMIFMTANLGSDIVTALCEEKEPPASEVIKEALLPVLQNFFRPGLLGRMTVVPYTTIRPEILKELVKIKLGQVAGRLLHRHRIHLDWAEEVVENIAASCLAVDTGARNIDHILNATLLPGIASALLATMTEQPNQATSLQITLHAETGGYSYTWNG
jgi:type VI secretion system protein VasG